MDRFRERIPFFHGDDARTTIIGRSNRATFAMKKLSEWKETGGGSHAAEHARRSASPTIYLKARRFPFARYDPTQRCIYGDVSARLSFCTYHYLDTRAPWARKQRENRQRSGKIAVDDADIHERKEQIAAIIEQHGIIFSFSYSSSLSYFFFVPFFYDLIKVDHCSPFAQL